MIRLKKILFPTDFSECSRRAQDYACALAEQFQADLHLLHVLQDVTPYFSNGGGLLVIPDKFFAEQKDAADQALSRLLPANWNPPGQIVRLTRLGNPVVEIVNYAKEKEIDVVVMGTHGRTALTHMLLGSVAEKVVRKSPCPVLAVHPLGHQFV